MPARGKALEGYLDHLHLLYRQRRWAFVAKQQIPTSVVKGTLVRSAKALPDYMGFVSGVYDTFPILFDAKETRQARWPTSNLEPHQLRYMQEFERIGGIAFVYLSYMPGRANRSRSDFLISPAAIELASKTVPIEEMREIGVAVPAGGDLPGWIGCIPQLVRQGIG